MLKGVRASWVKNGWWRQVEEGYCLFREYPKIVSQCFRCMIKLCIAPCNTMQHSQILLFVFAFRLTCPYGSIPGPLISCLFLYHFVHAPCLTCPLHSLPCLPLTLPCLHRRPYTPCLACPSHTVVVDPKMLSNFVLYLWLFTLSSHYTYCSIRFALLPQACYRLAGLVFLNNKQSWWCVHPTILSFPSDRIQHSSCLAYKHVLLLMGARLGLCKGAAEDNSYHFDVPVASTGRERPDACCPQCCTCPAGASFSGFLFLSKCCCCFLVPGQMRNIHALGVFLKLCTPCCSFLPIAEHLAEGQPRPATQIPEPRWVVRAPHSQGVRGEDPGDGDMAGGGRSTPQERWRGHALNDALFGPRRQRVCGDGA
jgi:hypothetical protein